MNLLRQLPNSLTLLNLTAGMLGVIFMAEGQVITSLILMGVCLVADIFDGMLARGLGVADGLGIQLDSIADTVSFGVLPGMMLYHLGVEYGGDVIDKNIVAIMAALTVGSAGLRLARFNIDTRDKHYFWGLATPAGAMLIAGWTWAQHIGREYGFGVKDMPYLIFIIPLFVIIAFQIGLRLPGLKSPRVGIITAGILFGAIAISVFIIGPIAITAGLIIYVLLGVMNLVLKWY